MNEKLKCWHCGSEKLLNTPTMEKPLEYHGDKLIFTVCGSCWSVNEFVNGQPAKIAIDLKCFGSEKYEAK